MSKKREVGVGIVGAGFLAETRGRCYAKAGGYPSRIVAVADTDREKAEAFAEKYKVESAVEDVRELLANPEVDLVDLCVPNFLHRPMTEMAAEAGKHVACTKPMTAYVGQDLGSEFEDREVSDQSREHMLEVAVRDAEAMVEATSRAGVKLIYGENWIYSPSVQKAGRMIEAAEGTILEMRGGECHSGSHSPFSKVWRYTGGGALIRLGAHPVGTMLYLKRLEGLAREGKPIRPVSVTAEVGDLSKMKSLQAEEREWVARGWEDVENWGSALLTFSDGSRGMVWASDTVLGGMESRLEVYLSNAVLKCNLSPNHLLESFAPESSVFGDEYIMEKVETKAGWNTPIPDEDWTSGHWSMCQSFVETVGRDEEPITDGHLGLDVVKVIYSAYLSADRGERVSLDE